MIPSGIYLLGGGGFISYLTPWCHRWSHVGLCPLYRGAHQTAMDLILLLRCFLPPEMKERKILGEKKANLMFVGSITLELRSWTPQKRGCSPLCHPVPQFPHGAMSLLGVSDDSTASGCSPTPPHTPRGPFSPHPVGRGVPSNPQPLLTSSTPPQCCGCQGGGHPPAVPSVWR